MMNGADDIEEIARKFRTEISKNVAPLMGEWMKKFQDKEDNYNASWLLTGQTLYEWFGEIKLDTPQKHVIYGLVTRMLDKIIRASNLQLKCEKDKVGEAAKETFSDLGVYAFMAAVATLMGD